MKLNPKTEAGCRLSDVKSPTADRRPPASERGIALVITLILLSVTLVMAIAFLTISRHERGSVTTETQAATARFAADSALANAQAQIIANIFATKNPYNYGLLVSTNYINSFGFVNNDANFTNVNYDFVAGGGTYTPDDFLQNLANLFYSPRPPVYITNSLTGATDFRFYLDLNRNGYDTNGLVPNFPDTNLVTEVGDPEWIGVLERPDTAHGPNNKFLSRYAFIAIPVGEGLDLNAIHNQTRNLPLNPAQDGYFRNQGVGSWEINLAAFLTDLNTNYWDTNTDSYNYQEWQTPNNFNSGRGFEDALSLLSYRYANNYNTLFSASVLFPNGAANFTADNIDEYADGPLQFSTAGIDESISGNADVPTLPWAGADNTNHFFDLSADLFDPTKSSVQFTNNLQQAGNSTSTYDRYTFYRLLDQLGTDSSPETGKMNLNYDNLDLGLNGTLNATGTASATNFVPWTPLGFFTNAADRLLRGYTGFWLAGSATSFSNFTNTYAGITNAFGVTNIPVLVNGRFVYTPTVNRLLQLAANIYDSVYYTNNPSSGAYLPSVFQPVFSVQNSNVYITSFVEVINTNFLSNPLVDLNDSFALNTISNNAQTLVYGVPLIIGAKKGFPNFNQFAMETAFGLERKLQVTRAYTNTPVGYYQVNQEFTLSLSNQLAVECWNSYTNNYTRPVNIYATDITSLTVTNDMKFYNNYTYTSGIPMIGINNWPAFNPASPSYASAEFPVNTNLIVIPDSIFVFNNGNPYLIPDNTNTPYETGVNVSSYSSSSTPKYPQPLWGLAVTNRMQVYMMDQQSGRLIDYVQLSGPNTNLSMSLYTDGNVPGNPPPNTGYNGMWDTNGNTVPRGISYQKQVSQDNPVYYNPKANPPIDNTRFWNGQNLTTVENEIDAFLAYYGYTPHYNNPNGSNLIAAAKSSLSWQVPYTPATNFYQFITWQANDPLVHYLATDLTDANPNSGYQYPLITTPPNERYQPWGAKMLFLGNNSTNSYNLSFKDPLVMSSDYWDFPTNALPTVGWLGRIHRGTPWQTVFLKATNVLSLVENNQALGQNTWDNWTGNQNPYDADNAAPVQDRLLFDFFTTSPNDNATRGQLSINQPHLAAWSALLSGIVVPTNNFGAYTVISPAGPAYTNAPGPPYTNALGYIYQNGLTGITDTRNNFTNADGLVGAFEHVGDILSVHALNDQSPFLAGMDANNGVSDEMYEWLPQQTMSLLRVSSAPRYVIYSYGQTLAPALNAIVAGGQYSGMITNYQVVSETATRTLVQVNKQMTTNYPGGFMTISTNYSTQILQFNILPPD
jgi:hypothetical protein